MHYFTKYPFVGWSTFEINFELSSEVENFNYRPKSRIRQFFDIKLSIFVLGGMQLFAKIPVCGLEIHLNTFGEL